MHIPTGDEEMIELPWWRDNNKYFIGNLSIKTRKISLVNMLHMLTFAEDIIEVPGEETISEILERYKEINVHAASYTWKRLGIIFIKKEDHWIWAKLWNKTELTMKQMSFKD